VNKIEVVVPELGGADHAEVIEIPVEAGVQIAAGATLVVVESEKAAMEIPAPVAGQVMAIKVALGDEVRAGTLIALIESAQAAPANIEVEPPAAAIAEAPAPTPAETGRAGRAGA
jgi:pyruvate/2-oxoglutarate dehydrogenase complex dihydrolipoamide acyltransferase (E2) component